MEFIFERFYSHLLVSHNDYGCWSGHYPGQLV